MIFEFKDVTLGYENTTVAANLNFSVNEGEYVCIVGENGTGKSTLVKTLLGLIKPLKGKIIINADGKNHKGIGYLPQQTQAQRDFPASVWEVVLSGVLNRGHRSPFYTKKDKAEAIRNMEKLGIAALKKSCYRELSGGQQQRVLLARALCATDSVLILDEPVTGLDPAAAMEFYDTVRKLNEKEGVTVIMVTHDIENALDYASHILHLKQDSNFYGTVEEYKKSNVSNMFLEKAVLDRIYKADEIFEKTTAQTIDRFFENVTKEKKEGGAHNDQ
ncbi:MAG: metal ABC transporter ATP-binding protein [Eubacterium sp.]